MTPTKFRTRIAVSVAALAVAISAAACDQAEDTAKNATDSAKDVAGSAASAATDAAGSAAEAGKDAAGQAGEMAGDAADKAKGALSDLKLPGGGDLKLDGPAAEAFTKFGGTEKLGQPTGEPQKVGDGTAIAFEKGTIFESPSTGAHIVQGEILRVYTEKGGAAGSLGFPTADEATTTGGWVSEFQHGTIKWTNESGTFAETVTTK